MIESSSHYPFEIYIPNSIWDPSHFIYFILLGEKWNIYFKMH